jgi:biopolymer transport protein ExbD
MAQALGTDDKRSSNIELNVVPFIDVLACLTAFLLVAAVWIDIARIEIKPSGRGPGECIDGDCDQPKLSVLLDADEIWIGVSRVNDFQKIPRMATGYDWTTLEQALRSQKSSAFFHDRTDIEIAAASRAAHPILYQDLIATMDIAVKAGFVHVGITDPQGLSARPTL